MLDLNHPMTKHIIAASGLEDKLMELVQKMTLAPTSQRLDLLKECHEILKKLRILNRDNFKNSEYINTAIEDLQNTVEHIAHLGNEQILEDRSTGEGECAVCSSPIIKRESCIKNLPPTFYCRKCMESYWPARAKFDSPKGFGTCFI